jgi:hypothetical protein
MAGSVRCRVDAGIIPRVVVRSAAAGDLDATIDVDERLRSSSAPSPATSAIATLSWPAR